VISLKILIIKWGCDFYISITLSNSVSLQITINVSTEWFLILVKKHIMKKKSIFAIVIALAAFGAKAQDLKSKDVPAKVKAEFIKKYPESATAKVGWEKEKGNYEANWGGKSGEDNSAVFTPAGSFVEIVKAIAISDLPKSVAPYVTKHYKGAKIKEAGKVTDAKGKTMYEAEIKGGDLIFDEKGVFIKKD
jgi:hypothetical protein